MASKIILKNGQDQEFSITHPDNVGAININSNELVSKDYVDDVILETKQYVDSTKAPLASPALTGVPTAPTAAVGTNNTQIATTAFVLANGASASNVATATAGLSAGSVGSYIFATGGESAPARTLGSTWAGSSLKAIQPLPPSNLTYSSPFSGTWRYLGGATIVAGLYLRIA